MPPGPTAAKKLEESIAALLEGLTIIQENGVSSTPPSVDTSIVDSYVATLGEYPEWLYWGLATEEERCRALVKKTRRLARGAIFLLEAQGAD